MGLLTAADVDAWQSATDGGARVDATVGVHVPTWAASPEGAADPTHPPGVTASSTPGTINIVAFVPEPLADGALVNLVATVTEAKSQALLDAGIPGTGTATDAVCIVSPRPEPGGREGELEPFGGPRSRWGARVARAVHASVSAGTALSIERIEPGGERLGAGEP